MFRWFRRKPAKPSELLAAFEALPLVEAMDMLQRLTWAHKRVVLDPVVMEFVTRHAEEINTFYRIRGGNPTDPEA